MKQSRLEELIAKGEQLDLEFKSDRRTFSDKEIYEEVVAMANSDGGTLLIGVEDDGQVAGAHHRHGTVTDPMKVRSAIFHNTVPNILARVSVVDHPDGEVIAIEVEPYPEVCATAQGKALRRVIGGMENLHQFPFIPGTSGHAGSISGYSILPLNLWSILLLSLSTLSSSSACGRR